MAVWWRRVTSRPTRYTISDSRWAVAAEPNPTLTLAPMPFLTLALTPTFALAPTFTLVSSHPRGSYSHSKPMSSALTVALGTRAGAGDCLP